MEIEKKQRTYRRRNPREDGMSSNDNSSFAAKRDRSVETKAIEEKIDAFFEANKESGPRKLISAAKLMEVGAHIGLATRL
jgi:hypothetical protein